MRSQLQDIFVIFKKRFASEILFWICIFFIARLFHITDAPVEMAHSWRQAFTNSIARNFLEVDNNIFYPRSFIFGNNPGIVGTEFPFLNYLIYICAKLFGYTHWYGRLINLLISSVAILYFYKIIFKFIKPAIAFNAAMILMCSLWFIFSRKSMPDTFSISFVMIGLFYGLNYLYGDQKRDLIFYVVFTMLGILCKIPGIYLLAVFAVPVFDSKINLLKRVYFVSGTLLLIIPVLLWYFYWVPHLDSMYGNWLYSPRTLVDGVAEVFSKLRLTAEKFYFSSLESYIGFLFFLAGCFFMFRNKNRNVVITFSLLTFIFILFIFKTGIVFPLHSYYVIPFVPVIAVLAAYGLEQITKPSIRTLFLFIIIAEAIANQQDDFFIKKSQLYKLELESVADRVSSPDDLIAINSGDNPQLLYLAYRKGWRLYNEQAANIEMIRSLKEKKCKYLFIDKHQLENSSLPSYGKEVYNDSNFIVYDLTSL
jgi:4-amino-4-deoxy-L-arabinose transferase-like glycosyltransferase